MPSKETIRRAQRDKREGKSPSTQALARGQRRVEARRALGGVEDVDHAG